MMDKQLIVEWVCVIVWTLAVLSYLERENWK